MAKLIKGYYKDGVWHEYGGKLYDTIGYNTNGSMTQKAISDTLGGVLELISGYSMAIRVHGDASVTNLNPFYFVTDGESFTITITYNQPAIALNVISIIMDGTDITQEAYQDGIISIDRVTGNVVITVETASVTNTNMFTSRTTADGATIINDKAKLISIRGNTLLWRKQGKNFFASHAYRQGGPVYYKNEVTSEDGVQYSLKNDGSTIASGFLRSNDASSWGNNVKYAYADLEVESEIAQYSVGFVWGTSYYLPIPGTNTAYANKKATNVVHRLRAYTSAAANKYPLLGFNNYGTYRWFDGTKEATVKITHWSIFDLSSMFGKGNEPTQTNFLKLFPLDNYDYNDSFILLNNKVASYISKDENNNTIQTVNLNLTSLTGKLNGSGESIVIFPDGLKSTNCISGTTDCAYLQKSDSKASYFDLDYVPTGQDIVIKAKIRFTSYIENTGNKIWIKAGAGGTGASTSKNWYGIVRATANSNILAFCGNRNDTTAVTNVAAGNTYEFELSFGNLKWNGTDIAINTTVGLENQSSLQLFNGINGYVYYVQVYKGEDLVVDCIPYRDTEQVGLWDRARNRLITLTQSNGEGTISPIEPTYSETPPTIYDEIKQVDGVWKAYKRVGTLRTGNNANSSRGEYVPYDTEQVYVLEDQTIPTELTVANGGTEEILPVNGTTPTTAAAIMEIQYGAIPSRGLLGGLLGGTKGGGSNEPDYSDGEEIADYEEEQENADEPIVEEPLEEPSDEEPKEDENEEEPKEDIKESPVIGEKQELKK